MTSDFDVLKNMAATGKHDSVAMCPDLLRADKTKRGAEVVVGVPVEVMNWLAAGTHSAFLYVVNMEDFAEQKRILDNGGQEKVKAQKHILRFDRKSLRVGIPIMYRYDTKQDAWIESKPFNDDDLLMFKQVCSVRPIFPFVTSYDAFQITRWVDNDTAESFALMLTPGREERALGDNRELMAWAKGRDVYREIFPYTGSMEIFKED